MIFKDDLQSSQIVLNQDSIASDPQSSRSRGLPAAAVTYYSAPESNATHLDAMWTPRAEQHLGNEGKIDEKDWVAQNKLPFFLGLGAILGLLMLFCLYALHRGPMRPLFPCCACGRRGKGKDDKSGDMGNAGGPDYSVWAQAQGSAPNDWGQKVYLTDLKRQSLAQPGYDQRMITADWTPPQHRSDSSSPASSSPRGSYHRSPASTFHSHTHLVPAAQPYHSPSDNLGALPRRVSSLPPSPYTGSPLAPTAGGQRDSFGHAPSMYTNSSMAIDRPTSATVTATGLASQPVSVPPMARVAYSPFAPRGSMLGPESHRDSIRSERGYAV